MIRGLFAEVSAFVQQVYLPDVCAVGAMYPEWLKFGAGVMNYLAGAGFAARLPRPRSSICPAASSWTERWPA